MNQKDQVEENKQTLVMSAHLQLITFVFLIGKDHVVASHRAEDLTLFIKIYIRFIICSEYM